MSAPNQNNESLDDLHDRLVDRALTEVVGNDAPPDLSASILTAHRDSLQVSPSMPTIAAPRRRAIWLTMTAAAVLIVGAVISSTSYLVHDAAKSPANGDRLGNVAVANRDQSTPRESAAADSNFVAATSAPAPSGNKSQTDLSAVPGDQLLNEVKAPYKQGMPTEAHVKEIARRSNRSVHPTALAALQESERQDVMRDVEAPATPSPYYLADDVRFKQESALSLAVRPSTRAMPAQDALAVAGPTANTRGFDLGETAPSSTAEGTGPGLPGDQYTRIVENPFIVAKGAEAVSTFSIDVDTASYANVRQFLTQMNQLPPADAVRIEELINYFDYDYAGPKENDEAPFAAHVEVADCPWNSDHRLVRIGIKGRELERDNRPKSNLVFLVDVSGSMDQPNKLPLVVHGLQQLTRELGENDRVSIVVYAGSEGLVLPSTPGSEQQIILNALGQLQAGGSTAGGAGIQLAYQIAEDNYIEGGTNRVILCTDGDFNVGVTSTAELERLCEQKAKDTRVFLSVLGFGRGNLNDAMMQAISSKGNGNHHYVDNQTEARRVLVEEMTGTLITIAKDVKIQVEFNPQKVAGYRLIGYENRMLRTEDFNDDKKDAGEIGAGHTVTALYEVVPAGNKVDVDDVDDLKYQQPQPQAEAGGESTSSDELLTLKMRYKQPEGDTSKKLEWPASDDGQSFSAASQDFQFAAAVAGFGLMLRDSQYKGNLTCGAVMEIAQSATGEDKQGYRAEFVELVRKAKELRHE